MDVKERTGGDCSSFFELENRIQKLQNEETVQPGGRGRKAGRGEGQ